MFFLINVAGVFADVVQGVRKMTPLTEADQVVYQSDGEENMP